MIRFKNSLVFYFVIAVLPLAVAACGDATDTSQTAETPSTGGDEIRVLGDLLIVATESMDEETARRISGIEGVSQVDLYLEIKGDTDLVVGVSPGSPSRVGGELVRLVSGNGFADSEDNVAVLGIGVNANSYGFGMTASAMAHRFEVGQSLQLGNERLRVTGLYEAKRDDLENAVLIPLTTAQRIYGREGEVSTVVITAQTGKVQEVRETLENLLRRAGR